MTGRIQTLFFFSPSPPKKEERAAQRNQIYSAALAGDLAGAQIGGNVRPAVELSQRQTGEPEESESAPGFFGQCGGGVGLPAVSRQ